MYKSFTLSKPNALSSPRPKSIWRIENHTHTEQRFIPEELINTYREIVNRVDFHIKITRRRSQIYHWLSRVLLWVTPVLSGVLTTFIGEREHFFLQKLAFYLSCVVTIMTAMNSTIRPYDMVLSAEKYANDFWQFHTDLELDIEKIYNETKNDEQERSKKINQLLKEKNKKLCELIEEFNKSPNFKITKTRSKSVPA